jgi:hypothetical protein
MPFTEFYRRLNALQTDQAETALKMQELMNEQFGKLRKDVEDMRTLLNEMESKARRRVRRKDKKLRQSLPPVPPVENDVMMEEEDTASGGEVKLQLERESRGSKRASPHPRWGGGTRLGLLTMLDTPHPPPPAPVVDQEDEDMLPAPPLMEKEASLPPPPVSEKSAASDKATPVPVAPVAPMAPMIGTPVVQSANSSPAASPAATPVPTRRPQKAKCSGPRGGLAPGVPRAPPAETEPKPVPASRTGVHMATRSKVPRGTTGISRADVAAAKETREKEAKEAKKKEAEENGKAPEKPPAKGGFTPVNTETLMSSASVFLKTNGQGASASSSKKKGSETGMDVCGSDTAVLNRSSVG